MPPALAALHDRRACWWRLPSIVRARQGGRVPWPSASNLRVGLASYSARFSLLHGVLAVFVSLGPGPLDFAAGLWLLKCLASIAQRAAGPPQIGWSVAPHL